ncbi:hypothetical protein BR93DRAFT_418012 [Coniochaeta sp. PMI_546]|nr:hypothetical protein BR93DRAFT_418012 [Coniochaeta sp. PMI_546]
MPLHSLRPLKTGSLTGQFGGSKPSKPTPGHKPGDWRERVWWTYLPGLPAPPPFSRTNPDSTWHVWMRDKGANQPNQSNRKQLGGNGSGHPPNNRGASRILAHCTFHHRPFAVLSTIRPGEPEKHHRKSCNSIRHVHQPHQLHHQPVAYASQIFGNHPKTYRTFAF